MRKGWRLIVLSAITLLLAGFWTQTDVLADYTARTQPLKLTDNASNVDDKSETEGWEWKASEKQLILKDGFTLNYETGLEAAMTLKAGTTIVLEGDASIKSNNTAIDAKGDLDIIYQPAAVEEASIVSENSGSAEEVAIPEALKPDPDAFGELTIQCTEVGSGSTCNYGIRMENECYLTVKEDALVEITGGNGCLYASSDKGALLNVGSRGAVILSNSKGVGGNKFEIYAKDNRVLFDATNRNGSFTYMKKGDKKAISSQTYLKLLAVEIESDYKNDMSAKRNDDKSGNDYEVTYDGMEHPIRINASELDNLELTPTNFSYKDTSYSEYLEEEGTDYRDKKAVDKNTTYKKFTEKVKYPKEAAEYAVSYRNVRAFANFKIKQRKVYIKGLKAKNKTYDNWEDAEIDYSALEPDDQKKIENIVCINDFNGNVTDENKKAVADITGIPLRDIEKLGVEIVPYAKAYFLKKAAAGDTTVCTIDGTSYAKSKDVAYENNEIHNGLVENKNVLIDEIYLTNPNYDVQVQSGPGVAKTITLSATDKTAEVLAENKSQAFSQEKIYPRNLTDKTFIKCWVTPKEKTWSKDASGESIWKEVERFATDTSCQTPQNRQNDVVNLVESTDYALSTNSYNEIGKQIVLFTGRGNYKGSVTDSWLLLKARRDIYLMESDEHGYDGQRYVISNDVQNNVTPKNFNSGDPFDTDVQGDTEFGKNDFAFMIVATTGGNDGITPTKENVTPRDVTKPEADLENGCGFSITYEGTKLDGTKYEKSELAPIDAGDYTVTVHVDETEHYLAAEKSTTFTIYPRVVDLRWSVSQNDTATPAWDNNPTQMTYNGTNNILSAVVINNVTRADVKDQKPDVVNVTEYTYNGDTRANRSKDSEAIRNLKLAAGQANEQGAPRDAGTYYVNATAIDNINYTLAANKAFLTPTPKHDYRVDPKEVGMAWSTVSGNQIKDLTFNNLDQTPVFTVLDLCKNEAGVTDVCNVRRDSIAYAGFDVYGDAYANPYTGKEDGTVVGTAAENAKTDILPERKKNSLKAAPADYKQDDWGAVNASRDGSDITITAGEYDNPNYEVKADDPGRVAAITISPLDLTTLSISDRSMTLDNPLPDKGVELWAHLMSYTGYEYPPVLEWKQGIAGEVMQREARDKENGDALADIGIGRGDYTAQNYTSAIENRNEDYVIEITGRNNYKGTVRIPWNIVKLEQYFVISGVKASDDTAVPYDVTKDETGIKVKSFAFTYNNAAKAAPVYEYIHANKDILNDNLHTIEDYVEYLYEGTMDNGKAYKSSKMPTEAGAYKVTVTLIETDNYEKQTDSADFVIKPKEVTIESGVIGEDKIYDGTAAASLNFEQTKFIGLLDEDADEIASIFASKAAKDYITYNAKFYENNKSITDVRLVGDTKVADTIGISFEECQFDKENNIKLLNEDGSLDKIYDYVISVSGNQINTEAKILPRPVKVSGFKAKDRVYNGTTDVVLDITDVKIDGVIGDEKLTAKAAGKLRARTGEEAGDKDVLMKDGKPAAKKVEVTVLSIGSQDGVTLADNYCIVESDQQNETTAVISPATLKISGIKAEEREYDGTTDAKNIDWSNMKVSGACEGDFVILQEESDSYQYPKEGVYETADVEYDKNGLPAEKKVIIEDFTPQFKEGFFKDDYVLDELGIVGTILPKKTQVTEESVKWTFDEEKQIPVASLADGSALELSVQYFKASDTEHRFPVAYENLEDDEQYVAVIVGLEDGNYEAADPTAMPQQAFVHDIIKEEPKKDDQEDQTDEETRQTEPKQDGTESKDAGQEKKDPVIIDDSKAVKPAETKKEAEVTEEEKIAADNQLNEQAKLSYKNKKLTMTWGSVSGADGYIVHLSGPGKKAPATTVVTGSDKTSVTVNRKNAKKKYFAYVEAFRLVDGKRVVIGKSFKLKCAGSKIKSFNAVKIKGCPNSLALGAASTYKLSAKVVLTNRKVKKGKKAGLVYWSSDPEIAKVSKKGVISPGKQGSCYVYVMAKNGLKKKIRITVG